MPYDIYPRIVSTDPALSPIVNSQLAAGPAAGLVATFGLLIKVPYTAGAGTSLDIPTVVPIKCRLVDAWAITTSTVTSAVIQCFTAAAGGGTAATSSMATAAAGTTRNALTTLPQLFAAGATIYCRQSGGATLAGGELYLLCLPEV